MAYLRVLEPVIVNGFVYGAGGEYEFANSDALLAGPTGHCFAPADSSTPVTPRTGPNVGAPTVAVPATPPEPTPDEED